MTGFLKNPAKWLVSTLARSVPSNWFLSGSEAPYKGEQTRISDPWAQSSWIFAALRLIAQPIAAARMVIRDAETGEPIDDAELRRFWSAPARGAREPLGLAELIETTVAIRGVAGGVFWILDDTWMLRSQKLRNPILVAAPSQMTPMWDGRRLDGWVYRDGSGQTMTLAKEQAIHLRMPNPGDPDSLDGIAPWMPARHAAESSRAGSKFARRIMDQNGDRGVFLIAKHSLTDAQKEMLRAELSEKRRAADAGKYRDSVIGGDIEVVQNPISAVSSQFSAQLAMSRDEIFVVYGVPASMATASASYSVGAASDWYRLITGTCASESATIADAVARVSDYVLGYRNLASEIGGREGGGRGEAKRCEAEFDFSDHPVMAEVRTSRVEQLDKLFRIGVPIETGNEFLDLGLPEYPGWDERWLPVSFAPAEAKEEEVGDQKSEVGGSSRALDDVEELVRDWSAGKKKRSVARAEAAARAQDERRLARWKRVDGARSGDRERMKKMVTRHLMAARAETLANLKSLYNSRAWTGVSEYQVRAGVLEIVFDLGRWTTGLWTDLSRMLGGIWRGASEVAVEEADEVRPDEAGDYDPLTEADPRVVEALSRRQNLISGASAEMHAELLVSLEEGLAAGETLDELTARVREIFTGFSKVRAETIARTETGAAYEGARYLTFVDAGITQKGWLSGGEDGVTRPTHQAADGQIRAMDDFFEVGAARLLHPHDQIGGANYPGELINCRCVLTAEG